MYECGRKTSIDTHSFCVYFTEQITMAKPPEQYPPISHYVCDNTVVIIIKLRLFAGVIGDGNKVGHQIWMVLNDSYRHRSVYSIGKTMRNNNKPNFSGILAIKGYDLYQLPTSLFILFQRQKEQNDEKKEITAASHRYHPSDLLAATMMLCLSCIDYMDVLQ